ncbi:MAG: hypothetical protein MK212_14400 [Saprospiraceae bacterium]|nr:hypothetical protein [Saprospiraceae bacterium]
MAKERDISLRKNDHEYQERYTLESTRAGNISKKIGRPKLKETRIPFTTALSKANKAKLEMLSSLRGQRKADILNEILSHYFEKETSTTEKEVIKVIDKQA